jgi:hypothetical protein
MNRHLTNRRFLPAAGRTLAAGLQLATGRVPRPSPRRPASVLAPLMALVLGATGFAWSSRAQEAFTNGLVAYYPFHGDAREVWGGHHGKLLGNVTPATDRFGREGMACHFDGASYVNVPDDPALHLQALTISLWVQFEATTETVNLVNKDDWGRGYQFFKGPGENVVFGIGSEVDGWSNTEGNARVVPYQWHHLVATYDLGTLRVYLDGFNTDSLDRAAVIGYATNPLQISRNGATGGQHLSGSLSDLRLYHRALSADEVWRLHAYEGTRRPEVALRWTPDAVTPWFYQLTVGAGYQLQVSGDLGTWTNVPPAFSAPDSTMVHPQPFHLTAGHQLFFRLAQP